jgi:hypothetical protein
MAEEFLFSTHFRWHGQCYLVHVYRSSCGPEWSSHWAETKLGPDDRVISDGCSPEDVLQKQLSVLPLAILSRSIL